jgi:hypothetical protein
MNRMHDFFFCDELDDKREYISVSIGEVWLYFYKETLIGVRDMRCNLAAFLKPDETPNDDGYSHRIEIHEETVQFAMSEVYPDALPPKRLYSDDLTQLAFEWCADMLSKQIVVALNVNPKK